MQRFSFISVLLVVSVSLAHATPAFVKGWSKFCKADCQTNVTIYNAEGDAVSEGNDLSKTSIQGKKEVNDFGLVQLEDGRWIETEIVDLDYCTKKAIVASGPVKSATASSMGSGSGC